MLVRSVSRVLERVGCCAILIAIAGCQMTAPMHVWKRPILTSGGPVRVAVAPIEGEPQIAERLQLAIETTKPQSMPQLSVLFPSQLEQISEIQLAAYDGQPSTMAALSAARRGEANYLMMGNILAHHLELQEIEGTSQPVPQSNKRDPDSLTVQWMVIDVSTGQRVGEHTITMNQKEAEKNFPDLAFVGNADAKIIAASARRSWELVVPTTHVDEVVIDLPWFSPGSTSVRKGNGYARQGRWDLAEREWQEAADMHNWNTAAWTNLAFAAVAHEDFQLARDRLRHADTQLWPGDETKKELQWIEGKQREYHAAFELPPPSDGWSIPDPPTAPPNSQNPTTLPTPASQPKSLDDQPWYTAIPFIPPPGWSWSQWWSQPWVW